MFSILTCLRKDHDWNGCTCRRCGKERDEGHVPRDYNYNSCDICNDYHYMDCGDCEGHEITVTTCAICGKELDSTDSYLWNGRHNDEER